MTNTSDQVDKAGVVLGLAIRCHRWTRAPAQRFDQPHKQANEPNFESEHIPGTVWYQSLISG